jgi:hypothetical protein
VWVCGDNNYGQFGLADYINTPLFKTKNKESKNPIQFLQQHKHLLTVYNRSGI